ncbi:MAG: hypothetical protein SOT81_03910 [Treponema sp.]|nr:hypothetical protein [Treponema sp.]
MLRLNRLFFSAFATVAAFSFFSCDDLRNFEIPEKVSVAANAAYKFPLGNGEILVKDKISAAELRKTFNENLDEDAAEVKVYDYNPTGHEDDVLQYLIKYPIQEIPLGISADGSNNIEFSSKIPVSNLNSKISDALSIKEIKYPIYELGESAEIPDNGGISFDITSPDFKTMQVYSGEFAIYVKALENVSSDFKLNAKVVLCGTDGSVISSSNISEISHGNENSPLYLDLSGKSLVPNMRLKIAGSMSGGTAGNKLEYTISMKTQNLKISKVTGLNMTSDEIGDLDNDSSTPDGTVGFSDEFEFTGMNDSLVSASVEKGSLGISSKIPDGWSGINAVVSGITVSQSGADGFNIGEDEFKDVPSTDANYLFNKSADISGKTVKPSSDADKISFSGQVSISFENATVIFDDGASDPEIEVSGSCSIEKMGTMILDISALDSSAGTSGSVDTGLSFSTLLSDSLGEASNLIKNVEFSGVEGYVFALMPEISALKDVSYSTCKIKAVYDGGSAELLNSADGIKLKESVVDLDSLSDNETFTITDSSFLVNEEYSAKTASGSVCALLNAMPDNLKIEYELSGLKNATDTITLTGDDVEKLQGLKSIQIFLLVQIPLEFTLHDKYDFPENESDHNDKAITIKDVRELVRIINDEDEPENKDLFDRESADDWADDDKRKYLDLIKSVSVYYKAENSTNLEISANLNDDASDIKKPISFENSGSYIKLGLSGEEIQRIFDSYPFNPVVPVEIVADGEQKKISRNSKFGLSGYVEVVTDGTVEIWSKSDK